MSDPTLTISFVGVPTAESGKLASELKTELEASSKKNSVDLYKVDPHAQDLGSILDIGRILEHLPVAIVAELLLAFCHKHALPYVGKLVVTIICHVKNRRFEIKDTQEPGKLLKLLEKFLENCKEDKKEDEK